MRELTQFNQSAMLASTRKSIHLAIHTGVHMPAPVPRQWSWDLGQPMQLRARVVWSPSFAVNRSQLRLRFPVPGSAFWGRFDLFAPSYLAYSVCGRVIHTCTYACCVQDKVSLSAVSTLVMRGNITVHALCLDGALEIIAVHGAEVHIRR